MNVKIKQVNSFEITIGENTFAGFSKRSEWNGMVEFSSPEGKVIVGSKAGDFDNIFSGLFHKEGDVSEKDYEVIQVSPAFLDMGK